MEYLIVKWLHVLSSTVLFGTGIGSAYHLLMASRRGDPGTVAFVTAQVVRADWMFTTPTVLLQPLSGFWLMHLAGWPLDAWWIRASLLLYGVAIACWLPVVVIQIRLRDLAARAADAGQPLPGTYRRGFAAWTALGFVAFFAFLAIFWLMVAKPATL